VLLAVVTLGDIGIIVTDLQREDVRRGYLNR
jgi:hypothetical protein